MSYKTDFQSNNADLQTILDTVNNLPDKQYDRPCTVTISGYTVKRVVYAKVTSTGVEYVDVSPASSSVTLENVLSGSLFYFETDRSVTRTATGCTIAIYGVSGMYYSYYAPTDSATGSIVLSV